MCVSVGLINDFDKCIIIDDILDGGGALGTLLLVVVVVVVGIGIGIVGCRSHCCGYTYYFFFIFLAAAENLVAHLGAEVVECVCIVELVGFGGRERVSGHPLYTLLHFNDNKGVLK